MGIAYLRQGLTHYSQHGELPDNPQWNRLEARRALDPARFDHNHPQLRGLFDKAQAPGLLPQTAYWDRLRSRYTLNAERFKHYHPFLGPLVERDDHVRDSLEHITPDKEPPPVQPPVVVPPIVVPPPVQPPGGGGTITPGGGDDGWTAVVPEPPGAVLFALGLLGCALLAGWTRRRRDAAARPRHVPVPVHPGC